MTLTRRSFFQASTAAVAVAHPFRVRAAESSPIEQLRIGVIGFGGRGRAHIAAIEACENAKVVALADVDSKILNKTSEGEELFRTDDFRRMLDRDDIDAVSSATPNHWHTLIAVLAAQAGKHVYIEKPISHNMLESQTVAAASDRYGKLIQCGFQNRSDSGLTGFYERLHNGEFGKVLSVHGTCHRPRGSIGKIDQPLKIPENINYDLWLGPAKDQPIMRPRLHYDWHWDFNTGNGDVGNQGPHEWDLMNWALGDPEKLPTQMVSAGNRFAWDDAGNTPNVMACAGMSGDTPFRFEVMDLKPGCKPAGGRGVGLVIETEKGHFVGGRGGGVFTSADGSTEKFGRDKSKKRDGTKDHMQNFVDCVIANDRSGLRSDCAVAANSSSMAHMANISYQLGRTATPVELQEAFADTDEEREMISRLQTATEIYHKAHGSDNDEGWVLGPQLTFDNDQQQFVGESAEGANRHMGRDYRAGFELPKIEAVAAG